MAPCVAMALVVEGAVVPAGGVRLAVSFTAWLALGVALGVAPGCGSTELQAEKPDAAVADASAVDAHPVPRDAGIDSPIEAEAGDLPPALDWTQVYGNFVDGDLVSVWGTRTTGTGTTDVYVGTDAKSVYYLASGVSYWTGMADVIAGGGWGSDAKTVYAVGASAWLAQAGMASNGNLFHFTGGYEGTWEPVASGPFYAVWGSAPNDIYAAGEPGIVHSTDGSQFAAQTLSGTGAVLSVFGSGPSDVYAGTAIPAQTILHSAGDGTWQPVYQEDGSEAWAVWAGGTEGAGGDAYAIVVPTGMTNPPAHLVHSKAGQAWAKESAGDTPVTLVALWASSANDVYAGGWHTDSAGKTGDLFHSNGDGVWVRVPLPGKPYDVRSIWGTGADDVYVAIYDVEDGPTLLHGQP